MPIINKPIYNRILLKLSGEALLGSQEFGVDPNALKVLINEINSVVKLNVQIGLVIGAGNIFRGAKLAAQGIDAITGDQMGILATVMNALALRDALENAGIATRILSAVPVSGLAEPFNRQKALRYLAKNYVVIFAGGTGNPLFTTDSAASLRGIEIGADVLLKATKVDGIYSADPVRDPKAKRYQKLTYQAALDHQLGVMDITAFSHCRDHQLPIRVFNIHQPGVLARVVTSEDEGTLVTN